MPKPKMPPPARFYLGINSWLATPLHCMCIKSLGYSKGMALFVLHDSFPYANVCEIVGSQPV